MIQDDIDPRLLDYFKGTNQYDLFMEDNPDGQKIIIEAAAAILERFNGDVKAAVSYSNKIETNIEQQLFPKL